MRFAVPWAALAVYTKSAEEGGYASLSPWAALAGCTKPAEEGGYASLSPWGGLGRVD